MPVRQKSKGGRPCNSESVVERQESCGRMLQFYLSKSNAFNLANSTRRHIAELLLDRTKSIPLRELHSQGVKFTHKSGQTEAK